MISDAVSRELGDHRINLFREKVAVMTAYAEAFPSENKSLTHLPVPLKARTGIEAAREFGEYLRRLDPTYRWAMITILRPSGNYYGMASLIMPGGVAGSDEWIMQFLLSDLHMRLGAWWLLQVWRAADLTTSTGERVEEWSLLSASTSARALLESAARLHVEARTTIGKWDAFKRSGPPNKDALESFADDLARHVLSLHWASRIGQSTGKTVPVKASSIAKYIKAFQSNVCDYNVGEVYDWLCDAVHGSFGSNSVYTYYRGLHESKTHLLEFYARRPLGSDNQEQLPLQQDVAYAVADAVIIAVRSMLNDFTELRWMLFDVGLTSRVALEIDFDYFGRISKPGVNDRCACGSGRKSKKCLHEWGKSGIPPANLKFG